MAAENERYRSADQVLARHRRDMGDHLGRVYTELSWGLARIHLKWGQYKQLYAYSPARIALINHAAGWFFKVVQGALAGDVLLHIARLTDPERISGHDTLTIRQLPALVPGEVKADVDALQAAAIRACEPIRSWRNQRGAHTDLETAISEIPVPDVTNDQVESGLASLRALLNRIEQHYWTPTDYELISPPPGDADSLVYYLLRGIHADQARHQRLLDGKPLPEDLKHEELP